MKKTHFICLFTLLIMMAFGCQDNAQEKKDSRNQIQWTADSVCLQYGGQSTCLQARQAAALVFLQDGKPQVQALELDGNLIAATYPQYDRGTAVTATSFEVLVDGNRLTLSDGTNRFTDATGMGLLIVQGGGRKGELIVKVPDTKMALDSIGTSVSLGSSRVSQTELLKPKPSGRFMTLSTIIHSFDDEGTHIIDNDTGVAVIITDNFKFAGSCDAVTPDECCSNYDPALPPVDYSEWGDDYEADGRRLLACFALGSICTYTSGLKLIVRKCGTGVKICIDREICSVMIHTSEEQGICISVPADCTMENPFE